VTPRPSMCMCAGFAKKSRSIRRIRATLRQCAAPGIGSSCPRANESLTINLYQASRLFVLLLVFHTLLMEVIFHSMVEETAGWTLHLLGREALWAG